MVKGSKQTQKNTQPSPFARRVKRPQSSTCGICRQAFSTCDQCTRHMQIHSRPRSAATRSPDMASSPVISPRSPSPRRRPHTASGLSPLLPSSPRRRVEADPASLRRCMSEPEGSRMGRQALLPLRQQMSSAPREQSPPSQPVKVYVCFYCQGEFTDPLSLRKHSRIHGGVTPYSCTLCGKMFALYSLLVTHERTHTAERPHRCRTCQAVFLNESSLRTHQRSHSGSKAYRCDTCHEWVANEGSLRIHMQRHERYDAPRVCHVCGVSFSCDAFLKAHAKVHEMEGSTRCVICVKRFRRSRVLLRHSDVHADERQNVCDTCEKRFPKVPDGSWRRMRLLLPAERRFTCVYCGATFSRLHQLAAHETGHTDPPYSNQPRLVTSFPTVIVN